MNGDPRRLGVQGGPRASGIGRGGPPAHFFRWAGMRVLDTHAMAKTGIASPLGRAILEHKHTKTGDNFNQLWAVAITEKFLARTLAPPQTTAEDAPHGTCTRDGRKGAAWTRHRRCTLRGTGSTLHRARDPCAVSLEGESVSPLITAAFASVAAILRAERRCGRLF